MLHRSLASMRIGNHCYLFDSKGSDAKYPNGQIMKVRDDVIADGRAGVMIADFDEGAFADEYEGWDVPEAEMLSGRKLDSGLMTKTVEAGLIHCPLGTGI